MLLRLLPFIGLFQSLGKIILVSGGPPLIINIYSDATLHITRRTASQLKCEVCVGSVCQSDVTLNKSTDVVFTCPQPQAVFVVESVRRIVCTAACNGSVTPEDLPSLQDFNRTFTWNVNVVGHKAFCLDFTKAGLRQIEPTEQCQDKHVYTVSTGAVTLGRFCGQGTVKSLQVLREGRVSVQVPGGQALDAASFAVSIGAEITSPAMINVVLPEKTSSQEFFSPNFPESFPDDDVITWSFQVPYKYYTTVRMLNYTSPRCETKDPRLEYQLHGMTTVKKLSEPQLSEQQGSFNLSLQNCNVDKHTSVAGLTLRFSISAVRRGIEVRCTVDLKSKPGLLIHMRKQEPKSDCILKLNSLAQDMATITSPKVSSVSFIDCREEDLLININKTITCTQLRDCPHPQSLRVPALEKCIMGVVQEVRWLLQGPEHGAVELVSPAGNLQQSLPGRACNSTVLLTVSENRPQGITVGRFCPRGTIHKMQLGVSNISVSASSAGGWSLRQVTDSMLQVSFTKALKENYIFTVLPTKGTSALLATPAWPSGMKPHATVSWFVSFAAQLEAHVSFPNVSTLTCRNRPAYIKLHRQRSQDKMYIWQDQDPRDVLVAESFYLNMSNCLPVNGAFSVVSLVTLHTAKSVLLSTFLSVAGVLLLLVIAGAVFCIMRKSRKKQEAPEVSVYNPNSHPLLPGLGLPKESEDEDFHIYHCIDDHLVYGHLLQNLTEEEKPAAGVYRGFTAQQPLKQESEGRGAVELPVGLYGGFTGPLRPPDVPDTLVRPTCTDRREADEEISAGSSVHREGTTANIQAGTETEATPEKEEFTQSS